MAERPIILDGIGDFVAQADVADRSFFLHLSPISQATRRTEEAFWADFDRDCPKLLGGLLDAVSAGMRMMPNVHLEALSRMADAERRGEAVVRGLGRVPETFTSSLESNRTAAGEAVLEDSPVAETLIKYIVQKGAFSGAMQDAEEEDQPLVDGTRPTFRQRARAFLQRFAGTKDSDYGDQSSSHAGQEKPEDSNNSS